MAACALACALLAALGWSAAAQALEGDGLGNDPGALADVEEALGEPVTDIVEGAAEPVAQAVEAVVDETGGALEPVSSPPEPTTAVPMRSSEPAAVMPQPADRQAAEANGDAAETSARVVTAAPHAAQDQGRTHNSAAQPDTASWARAAGLLRQGPASAQQRPARTIPPLVATVRVTGSEPFVALVELHTRAGDRPALLRLEPVDGSPSSAPPGAGARTRSHPATVEIIGGPPAFLAEVTWSVLDGELLLAVEPANADVTEVLGRVLDELAYTGMSTAAVLAAALVLCGAGAWLVRRPAGAHPPSLRP